MSFKDQLADDAANIFCNDDEYAEEITYGKIDGTERTVNALVYRGGADASAQVDHGVTRSMTVLVPNKAAPHGILATEIDSGQYFKIAWDIGATPEKIMFPKSPLGSQDDGMLEFQFNKGA